MKTNLLVLMFLAGMAFACSGNNKAPDPEMVEEIETLESQVTDLNATIEAIDSSAMKVDS